MATPTDLPEPAPSAAADANGKRRAIVAAGIGSAALAAALLYCRSASRAKSRVAGTPD
ncbi:MAG TPA: hypothetical protein VEC11_11150 [Allosphingosinicella sp.]|nr:hypothetical protein [Allosphingosinicella sp.]